MGLWSGLGWPRIETGGGRFWAQICVLKTAVKSVGFHSVSAKCTVLCLVLKYCGGHAVGRKVAGPNPIGVTGILH